MASSREGRLFTWLTVEGEVIYLANSRWGDGLQQMGRLFTWLTVVGEVIYLASSREGGYLPGEQ